MIFEFAKNRRIHSAAFSSTLVISYLSKSRLYKYFGWNGFYGSHVFSPKLPRLKTAWQDLVGM